MPLLIALLLGFGAYEGYKYYEAHKSPMGGTPGSSGFTDPTCDAAFKALTVSTTATPLTPAQVAAGKAIQDQITKAFGDAASQGTGPIKSAATLLASKYPVLSKCLNDQAAAMDAKAKAAGGDKSGVTAIPSPFVANTHSAISPGFADCTTAFYAMTPANQQAVATAVSQAQQATDRTTAASILNNQAAITSSPDVADCLRQLAMQFTGTPGGGSACDPSTLSDNGDGSFTDASGNLVNADCTPVATPAAYMFMPQQVQTAGPMMLPAPRPNPLQAAVTRMQGGPVALRRRTPMAAFLGRG